jgi:hypothetical protein
MTAIKKGAAVFVQGELVAWFAEFNDEAQEWCSENHFGQWLTWPAEAPKPIPLTAEQKSKADAKVAEWQKFFNPVEL